MPDAPNQLVSRAAWLRLPAAVIKEAIRRFRADRSAQAAATMAFYAIFSLFPAVLLLAVVGRLLIAALGLEDSALDLVVSVFPEAFRSLVRRNVVEALAARGGAGGVVGILMLAWGASNGFAVLTENLNRAWMGGRPLGLVRSRLRAFGVVGFLVGLLAALLASRAALRLLPGWSRAVGLRIDFAALDALRPGVLLPALVFVTLYLLYRLVPTERVGALPAAIGALLASAGSIAATAGFTAFLAAGLVKYHLVYGSLGALIAFMVWVYIVGIVVLFGAYAGAAAAGYGGRRARPTGRVEAKAPGGETTADAPAAGSASS